MLSSPLQDTVVDHEAKWLGRDAGAQGAGELPVPVYTPCTVRLWGSYRSTELLFPFSSSQVYRFTWLSGCETGGCTVPVPGNHPFSGTTVENLSELNSTYRHISGRG